VVILVLLVAATSAATEEYDGSTWTSVNSLNTARFGLGGAGTQTAALGFWWWSYRCNRRMDRCRSTINTNNYSKLTGGKYGNKNIHRS
jgi:hypothetical protein